MASHLRSFIYDLFHPLLEEQDSSHGGADAHGGVEAHADDGGHGGEGGDGHSEFGVHIQYTDLYYAIVFLTCIYVGGQISSRLLKMPNLVGEIVAGILLGPPLADFVPFPEAWVLLGEIGLVLLVLEAGIDIDVSTLKLIGTRGCMIAIVGSVLPIGLGIALALAINGTQDIKAAIAAGATFGPTSLGIALNILRSGGILNTPVGQLIVSAAVIDDMIALIVLSLLESLKGNVTAAGILIPIVSAFAFLSIGGAIALFWIPGVVEKCVLGRRCLEGKEQHHGKVEMAIMFGFVLAMMPATFYAKASYLMGVFVSGLSFCTSHTLHVEFVRQFKRILQWLMRIFFAASIGFQVPIKDFANGTIIWQGLVFCLALLGKLVVGFMVPNFTQSRRFTGIHLRDCLCTGFSMAAEGEFAFVIAVWSVDNGLISKDLYASVVLAVLISTIIPPFALRFTISFYNKKAEAMVAQLAAAEMERNHDLDEGSTSVEDDPQSHFRDSQRNEVLASQIQNETAVFLCIQTQSEARWGLLHKIMGTLARLNLDIIDHRSWHPRGIDSTLINEIYVRDKIGLRRGEKAQTVLDERIEKISQELQVVVDGPVNKKEEEKKEDDDAPHGKVKVQRWYPGVVEEIIEKVDENSKVKHRSSLTLEQRILTEAAADLDRKQNLSVTATKKKTVEEILAGMSTLELPAVSEDKPMDLGTAPTKRARRRRQKMRSTPVVGGGLFGETAEDNSPDEEEPNVPLAGPVSGRNKKGNRRHQPDFDFGQRGTRAEIIVQGETYDIRINNETLNALRKGHAGDMLDSRGVSIGSGLEISPAQDGVVNQLQGYVRNIAPLSKITEEDEESETSSVMPAAAAPQQPGPPPAIAEESASDHPLGRESNV